MKIMADKILAEVAKALRRELVPYERKYCALLLAIIENLRDIAEMNGTELSLPTAIEQARALFNQIASGDPAFLVEAGRAGVEVIELADGINEALLTPHEKDQLRENRVALLEISDLLLKKARNIIATGRHK